MFERYTEKARRVIFFARYEASQFGSPYIETEHLLLGLLREDKGLSNKLLSLESAEEIRKKIELRTTLREKVSTSVDLPLSNESKRVLAYGAEEAERLSHKHIGTEHLLLGLLREKDCVGAQLLNESGVTLEQARQKIPSWPTEAVTSTTTLGNLPMPGTLPMLEVHGRQIPTAFVTRTAERLRQFAWVRRDWKPMDVVVDNLEGRICFELAVKDDPRYEFVAGGWTKEPCAICGWELSAEEGPERSEAFTNGRQWLCAECYYRFIVKKSAGPA